MIGCLLAYDAAGNIVATRDLDVIRDQNGNVVGVVNYLAREAAGLENSDIWLVSGQTINDTTGEVVDEWVAKGSKAWPEWLGGQAHAFRVELEGPPGGKRIEALVHKGSGHRRERATIEREINRRMAESQAAADAIAATLRSGFPRRGPDGRFVNQPNVVVQPEPTDIRDLVGGPDRPLILDGNGRTVEPVRERPVTPLVSISMPLASATERTDNATQQPATREGHR
jgi:hypothetical protein